MEEGRPYLTLLPPLPLFPLLLHKAQPPGSLKRKEEEEEKKEKGGRRRNGKGRLFPGYDVIIVSPLPFFRTHSVECNLVKFVSLLECDS